MKTGADHWPDTPAPDDGTTPRCGTANVQEKGFCAGTTFCFYTRSVTAAGGLSEGGHTLVRGWVRSPHYPHPSVYSFSFMSRGRGCLGRHAGRRALHLSTRPAAPLPAPTTAAPLHSIVPETTPPGPHQLTQQPSNHSCTCELAEISTIRASSATLPHTRSMCCSCGWFTTFLTWSLIKPSPDTNWDHLRRVC